MSSENGIPSSRNVHHVGVTVPDLEEATDFFVDVLGCELLYEKGPFGDPEGDTMERRLDVHPDAEASLAMLRCGPVTNLELFEWDAPDQDESMPANSDAGATHLGIHVDDIEAAVSYVSEDDRVELLDEPQTNDDGPTAGLTYVFFKTDWGMYLELLEAPEEMPYEDDAAGELFGPAESWDSRPWKDE